LQIGGNGGVGAATGLGADPGRSVVSDKEPGAGFSGHRLLRRRHRRKINNAFASFGAGRCGTVGIPAGSYTFSTTIYIRTGCILEGAGRGNDQLPFGTRLLYNGPPATAAIVMMNPDFTPGAAAAMNSRQVFVDRALTSFCSASASAIRPPLPTGSTSTRLETTEPSITGFDRHEVQHCRVAEQPLSRRFAAE